MENGARPWASKTFPDKVPNDGEFGLTGDFVSLKKLVPLDGHAGLFEQIDLGPHGGNRDHRVHVAVSHQDSLLASAR